MIKHRLKGSSYIYVITVMSIIFMILSILLSNLNSQLKIEQAEYKNNRLYYSAISKIEEINDIINNNIKNKKLIIIYEVLDNLENSNYEQIFEYKIKSQANKYDGEFYLADEDFFNKEFLNKVDSETQSFINNKFNYKKTKNGFKLMLREENDENIGINAEGLIKYNLDNSQSFIEDYEYKKEITALGYGFFTEGKINLQDEVIEPQIKSTINNIFDSSIVLREQNYDIMNPVIINNFGSLDIDISEFEEQPVIIINKGSGNLNIRASGNSNFNGIIVSLGTITIYKDIFFRGGVFSKGNINIVNGNINIFPDSKIIYEIDFSDIELKRRLLDAFYITNFKNIKENTVSKDSLISMLNNSRLKIKMIKSINSNYYMIDKLRLK